MSSKLPSHHPAASHTGRPFPDVSQPSQSSRRSVTYSNDVHSVDKAGSAAETRARRSKPPERVQYHTTGFAFVPRTSDAGLPIPASLTSSVPETANFETWLQELQATPALDHSDERQLRLARDARLLSALRDCHTDHLHHIRRLEDTRALAIHTLNLPIIRHLSAAQGREVRVHADTVSDRQLLSTRDEGNHRDDEDEDSDIEPSEYPCSSSDESSHLSHMSVAASRSTGTRIVEEYADAVPGQKRGRGVIEVIELE